jgi:hypothetical protein
LVRIGPTAWPFTGFIHTYIHTDRQLDKYILDNSKSSDNIFLSNRNGGEESRIAERQRERVCERQCVAEKER